MEINYQETSKDLLTRIDIHEKYGSANTDHLPGKTIIDARKKGNFAITVDGHATASVG